ncbi:phage tail tape measure protein [Olivibacter sp. LS-1]|uniref:phage tail tape measure protein n=1 Tax=Olivibacter sp. LS-1 TaxID=2592345 RepID=UPI0011EB6918|nr:phage tail tape measure protein [Olivibacter sp. LS-1]QEL01582.1 phage tail tape measure protein [Olivibacter sp. LS-1]
MMDSQRKMPYIDFCCMADIKYKVQLDDAEAYRRLERFHKISAEGSREFAKMFENITKNSKVESGLNELAKAAKRATSGVDDLNKTRLQSANIEKQQRQARLKEIEDLANLRRQIMLQKEEQARLSTEVAKSHLQSQRYKEAINELKVAEQQLNSELKKGAITAQEYALAQRKIEDAHKNAVAAQKEADRQAREHVKLLNEQLRLQRQQEAQTERNRRKLQQQSGEYYQLNQALNAIRRRSKDVLAEMFNLERQGLKNSAAYKMLEQRSKGMVAQTQFLDRAIKKIDATLGLHQRNVGNYASALDALSPTFARINSQLALMGVNLMEISGQSNGFTQLGATLATVGRNILTFLLSPIGLTITALASFFALIKGNARTVVQFNSGLLNVGKTTGLASDQLTKLGDSLIEMSRKLQVVSVDKLLEYATVAGQLGVKGTQNILRFSEALAKLETASNIQGEEGGSEIARLLTLVDGGVQNVADFGDEIVNLGNNFAATEKEILSNATQIAQNTGLYKIGRREALAYATATKAVGVEAELVGSAFGRVLGNFEKTIRTGRGLNVLLQVTGKSAEEIKKQFRENASGVFNDFIKGLNNINRAGGSVNEVLERLGINQIRDQRVVNSLATNGYDVLTDALEKAADAAGSMDREFETASQKLEKQWARIGIAWDNLVLSIENGEGIIGRAFVRIADGAATVLEMFTKIVTSTGWDEFEARLTSNKTADLIREITIAANEAETALSMGNALDIQKANGKQIEEVYQSLSSAYSEVKKQYDIYANSVKDGVLTEKGRRNLQQYSDLVSQLGAKMSQVGMFRVPQNGAVTPVNPLSEEEDAKAKRAREAAARRAAEALKRQRDLQAKIDEINKKAQRQQLSHDEEEIQAVKDKYAEIQRVVDGFYKDSRNKGLKVDTSGLSVSQQLEIDELVAKQQLEIEKQTIEQKKVLFEQYEEYKKQVGKEKANEAFREDIQGFESYLDYLRSLMPANSDTSVKANKTRDYLNRTAIPSAQKEMQKRDAELYRRSLQEAQTYADRIRSVQQRLEDDITRLKGKASEDQLNALRRNAKEEISEITASAIKQEHQWDETFNVMSTLSRKAAQEWLKNAERRLDYERRTGNLTVKEYQELSKQINAALDDINYRDPFAGTVDKIKDYRNAVLKYGKDSKEAQAELTKLAGISSEAFAGVANIVGTVADSFDKLGIGNEELQETLGKIGEVAGGLSELAQGIASKNPVSIITGAVKTLTSVLDLFNRRDKNLQKQIEGYQKALRSLEQQYNQLQRSIENSVGSSYYDDSAAAVKNLQEQVKNLTAARDAESKKKKADKDAIDAYNDQIIAANNAIQDLQKTVSEQLLQTNFKQLSDNLANALLTAFEAGENGIEALNDTFDQFIKNALANSLKLKLIEPLMKKMTDDLTKYMLGNDNSLVGYDFTSWRKQLEDAGKDFNEALDEAYKGLGLSKNSQESDKGITGQISRSITEDTANKWMGVQLNIYSITKNLYSEAQLQSKIQENCLNMATKSLTTALNIERNTAATVDRLDTAVGYLITIANNTNTKSSKGLRDMGVA